MPRNTVPIDHVRWRRRQRRIAVLYILSKNKSLDGLKCLNSQIKLFLSHVIFSHVLMSFHLFGFSRNGMPALLNIGNSLCN